MKMVVSKTKHSKTKTEARSTQNSKTKHPNLENEAPKTRKRRPLNLENEAPKTRKRSTQNSKTKHPRSKTKHPKTRNRSVLYKHETNANTAGIKHYNESNSPVPHHGAWSQAITLEQILTGSDLI